MKKNLAKTCVEKTAAIISPYFKKKLNAAGAIVYVRQQYLLAKTPRSLILRFFSLHGKSRFTVIEQSQTSSDDWTHCYITIKKTQGQGLRKQLKLKKKKLHQGDLDIMAKNIRI